MLSSTELTEMRNEQERNMPDTCYRYIKTQASDGAGGNTDTWSVSGSKLKCRLGPPPKASLESILAGRIAVKCDYTLTLPFDVTATEKDYFLVTANGATHILNVTNARVKSYLTTRVLQCVEVV